MYITNIAKNDLKWLQKALNKKGTRTFCKYILIKDGYAYATNGHVLHRIKVNEDEINGLYDYDGIKIDDEETQHPLRNRDLFTRYSNVCKLHIIESNLNILGITQYKGINKIYFNNAIDKSTKINILYNDDENSVLIEYENRSAIIMCVNLAL